MNKYVWGNVYVQDVINLLYDFTYASFIVEENVSAIEKD